MIQQWIYIADYRKKLLTRKLESNTFYPLDVKDKWKYVHWIISTTKHYSYLVVAPDRYHKKSALTILVVFLK